MANNDNDKNHLQQNGSNISSSSQQTSSTYVTWNDKYFNSNVVNKQVDLTNNDENLHAHVATEADLVGNNTNNKTVDIHPSQPSQQTSGNANIPRAVFPKDENRNVVIKRSPMFAIDTNGEGEPATGYRSRNVFNENDRRLTSGYPKSDGSLYFNGNQRVITSGDHDRVGIDTRENKKAKFLVQNTKDHFIRDVPQHLAGETYSSDVSAFVNENGQVINSAGYHVFSGATTNINPDNNEEKAEILKSGTLSKYIEEDCAEKELGSYIKPPLSPIHPFTRMNNKNNRYLAEESLYSAYNRTKLPVADLEWRKGFRHIFITRPECYLMYGANGNGGLCEQALYDEDFQSAFSRVPHLIKLLSPWYVSGSFPKGVTDTNWNFLLCNRVQGLSVAQSVMTYNENVSKSIEGFTIMPAMHVESRQGSTIDLQFSDTRTLDVYELNRLWMLYMYKRKKGIFIPPYNGYQLKNGFIPNISEEGKHLSGIEYTRYHPYDRALEYCASLYDIVTDETGTKILYWCKYYGIYPVSIQPTLSNEKNGPILDASTTVSFKYHYRLENTNKILIEFNHDAGLTDDIGRIKSESITHSMPFLLRNEYDNPVMKKYIGASGMFTGSPYVVMAKSHPDPLDKSNMILVPNLRFMNLIDNQLDGNINLGITNTEIDKATSNIVAYQ